jgi:hypothetical protein
MKNELFFLFAFFLSTGISFTQDSSQKWTRVGTVIQPQYLWNFDEKDDLNYEGFELRRGQTDIQSRFNNWLEGFLTVDISSKNATDDDLVRYSDSPVKSLQLTLKRLEAKIGLSKNAYLRAGYFKAPVWRDEIISFPNSFMIERSRASRYLKVMNFTGAKQSFELGYHINEQHEFILTISRTREYNRNEDKWNRYFVNPGKYPNLLTARWNWITPEHQFGFSTGFNRIGNNLSGVDQEDDLFFVVAPDFYFSFKLSDFDLLEFQGGLANGGNLTSSFYGYSQNGFLFMDLASRFTRFFHSESIHALEFTAGVTYVNQDGLFEFQKHVDPDGELNTYGDWAITFKVGAGLQMTPFLKFSVNYEHENSIIKRSNNTLTVPLLRAQLSFYFDKKIN